MSNKNRLAQQMGQNKQWSSPLTSIKEHLFHNTYALNSSLQISLPLASIILVLGQLQKFGIVSRLSVNPTISLSQEMNQVDAVSRYLLLDFTSQGSLARQMLMVLLLIAQLTVLVFYFIPIRQQGVRKIISKTIVLLLTCLTIPCILISMDSLVHQKNIGEASALLLCTAFNFLIHTFMGIECSFERQVDNVLVRVPYPLAPQLFQLFVIAMLPLLDALISSTSFLLYLLLNLATLVAKWWIFLHSFTFFKQALVQLKGVMVSLNISTHVCYLTIRLVSNAIIENNVLIFILAFSVFLGKFFIVYRNYIVKTTVINQEVKTENEIATFGMFYWHCYMYLAEKKNELYLSSLLKKHINECRDPQCCCKHREVLYDGNLRTYGNPSLQPHFDRIFIRHYIRSILSKGYEEHPKSTMLAFLLATFDIEALEMVTYTIQLIRSLVKLEQKKQLTFIEQYLLFCLRKKTRTKINLINAKRGNLDLESVKLFDQKTIMLHLKLRESVKSYFAIWKYLGHSKLKKAKLYKVCKGALELIFSIEQLYNQLKIINSESTELRTVMIFYSQMILHDIHMLSEIKKEVRNSLERNLLPNNNLQLNTLQLFGTKAASMITHENGKIKWASRNAHQLFEYPRDEFLGLTINSLMPKYFAQHHDEYIQKWKETGHHIKLNKVCYLWGSNKEGYCFSLLIYVKVVPLPHEQDYAFFASIEKVESQLAVICSPRGEIYGAGKLFPTTIGVNARLLQELRPNIQVFMPQTFQYFLQYFFASNPKFKAQKRIEEIRREGYFPQGLELVMRELAADRLIFSRNHRYQDNFDKEYLNFVRQRMQELTCSINGEYISFLINIQKVVELQREKRKILSLKFSNPKKDNIERYYNDLEKMIRRLQELTEEEETSNKKFKSAHKKTRSDFFKAFLNPRRVKRLLQEENMASIKQEEDGNKGQTLKSDSCLKSDSVIGSRPRKSACMIVAHRKKLALGAQVEIKNERVRYNLWRMKKILLQEGVISRYTYNLLIGKQNQAYNFQSLARLEPSATDIREETAKAITKNYEQRLQEEGKESIESDSQVGLGQCEENDNETFNSASSSATFISMTSQVKIFKEKLRSLNSPLPLLILNVLVIIVVVAGVGGLGFEAFQNTDNCDNGYREFQSIMEGNQILSMILEGQMNIQNYNSNTTNPYFQLKRNYLLEKATVLLKRQLSHRMQQAKINPLLMQYLTLIIIDHNTPLEVKEFFNIVINQIVQNQFSHRLKYFTQTSAAIAQHSSSNIFFDQISNDLWLIFGLYASAAVVLLLVTLPVLRSVKTKINEIYDLLTKLSANEKYQYFKHFWKMNDEFKKVQVINHEEITRITLLLEQDFCMFRRQMHSQDSLDETQRKEKQRREKEQEQNIGGSQYIYFKVLATYCIPIVALLFYFLFSGHYVSLNDQTYHAFIQAFNQKSQSTISFINCNFQLMGYAREAECYLPTMPIVQALYQTYHLPLVTDTYKTYLYEYSTGNVCNKLQSDDTIEFSVQQVALCMELNGGTFKQGGFNSMYYVQRKIEQRVKEYYTERNNTPNDESYLAYPDYFFTNEYFQINLGFFFGSVMHYNLFQQMNQEMRRQVESLKGYLKVAAVVTIGLLLIFLGAWVYLYLQLAENASYINAFLLLIPFKILTENPYIKLYIRNEFDYKAANY